MTSSDRPLVMSIEDNRDTQQLIERLLSGRGYDVVIAENGLKGIQMLTGNGTKPDLILLDVMMPEMNGYEFCSRLQENEELSYIPVVFLTALGDDQDKAKAFALGAVDYVTKPIFKNKLLEVVDKQLQTNSKWRQLQEHSRRISAVDFVNFKQHLFEELALPSEKRQKLGNIPAAHLYKFIGEFGIDSERLARYISNFLNLKYVPSINYTELQLGILPAPFCK